MNESPTLYRRGTRGIWWADFGEVGGVRHRRSTGATDEAAARDVATAMHIELQRHAINRRLALLHTPPAAESWVQQVRAAETRPLWSRMWKNARGRATRDDLLWSLSFNDFMAMLEASGGRCAVTNLSFDLADRPGNPFKPSLDRVDNSTGYSRGNCRLTLMAVNYAMNVWGADLFAAIALSFAAQRLQSEAQLSHSRFSLGENKR